MLNLIKSLLFENLGVKLVALLLAVTLYLHVYTERPATMSLLFPVEITDLGDSLALTGHAPEPVRAELKGTGKQLIRLRLSEPRLKVSLSGVGAGHYERTVVADDLPLLHDEGIEVQRLSPRVVTLDIDRKVARRVPVAARVVGTPHAGWSWDGRYAADPATVVVIGPSREISRIDSVRLRPVHVEGRRDTVKTMVVPDSLPPWCEIDPEMVRIVVPLRPAPVSR